MGSLAESGRKPVSKRTGFSLSVENEQADVGRDDRICLARLVPQAPMREENIFPV